MMKTNVTTFLTVFALLAISAPFAEASAQTETFKKSLSSVPAPEIPAKAASLVEASNSEEMEAVAISVVEAALALSPAVAPEVVGEIARKFPTVSPAIAAAAVVTQPKMAALIAKSAAVSAPKYAGAIVAAVCKKQPGAYAKVATAVARAVPKAGPSVLDALLGAIPNLKPFIEIATTMAGNNGSTVVVLSYASAMVDKTASSSGITADQLLSQGIQAPQEIQLVSQDQLSPSSPSGVPFVPGGGKSGSTNRSQTVVVVPGSGRVKDYSPP